MALSLISRSKRATPAPTKRAGKKQSALGPRGAKLHRRSPDPAFGLQTTGLAVPPVIQPKLKVGEPNDKYEAEADRVADQVMRVPGPGPDEEIQAKSLGSSITPLTQMRMASGAGRGRAASPVAGLRTFESKLNALGGGRRLSPAERSFFEPRFGIDFGGVRIHYNTAAAQSINAQAFTRGKDIVFGAGCYAPHTQAGKHLLAHELTHVVQQSELGSPRLQRTIGDGHDLESPRFQGDIQLEACFDNERLLKIGDRGDGVAKVQQALLDDGFPLPGVKLGVFGLETKTTIEIFQRQKGLEGREVDGIIGPITMGLLDAHFSGPAPDTPVPPTPLPTTPVKGRRFSYNSGAGQTVRVDIRASCGSPVFGFREEHFQLVENEARAALDAIFERTCISEGRRKWMQKGLVSSGLDIRCLRAPFFCAKATGFPSAAIMALSSFAFPPGAHRDSLAKCQPLRSAILHEIIHLAFTSAGEDLPTSCQKSCFPETPRPYDPTLCRTPITSGIGIEPS